MSVDTVERTAKRRKLLDSLLYDSDAERDEISIADDSLVVADVVATAVGEQKCASAAASILIDLVSDDEEAPETAVPKCLPPISVVPTPARTFQKARSPPTPPARGKKRGYAEFAAENNDDDKPENNFEESVAAAERKPPRRVLKGLTPEERRVKNREYARESRQRHVEKLRTLEEQNAHLQNQAGRFRNRIASLVEELEKAKRRIFQLEEENHTVIADSRFAEQELKCNVLRAERKAREAVAAAEALASPQKPRTVEEEVDAFLTSSDDEVAEYDSAASPLIVEKDYEETEEQVVLFADLGENNVPESSDRLVETAEQEYPATPNPWTQIPTDSDLMVM